MFIPVAAGQSDSGLVFRELTVSSEIINNYHLCNISATISNPTSTTRETFFSIKVPEDAMLISMKLVKDGKTYLSRVEEKEEAREEYESAVRNDHSASLVEWDPEWGAFQFALSIPSGTELSIEVEYGEMVVKYLGVYDVIIPLGDIGSYDRFESVRCEMEVSSPLEVTEIDTSPSTVVPDLDDLGDGEFYLEYVTTDPGQGDVFGVSYITEPLPVNGWMESCVSDGKGYFMHVFSPEVEDVGEYLAKDIVFVIDRSGSMSGDKIMTVKSSFNNMLSQLNEGDRFNIVHFNDEVRTYESDVIPATPSNIEKAGRFINGIDADGSTDINSALLEGVGSFETGTENVEIILFLTDGLPTSGVTDRDDIRANARTANGGSAIINTLGYGADHDMAFLKAIALENEGRYRYIRDSSDADDILEDEYRTISNPVLRDLSFSYSEGTKEIFPSEYAVLFEGSEVVIVGRYDSSIQTIDADVTAQTSEGSRVFSDTFPVREEGGPDHVMLLWAHRKIASLLDRITIEGETDELVGEVVSLAMNYSFVTPYTSFILVLETDGLVDPDLDDILDGDLNIGEAGLPEFEWDRGYSASAPAADESTPFLGSVSLFAVLAMSVLVARSMKKKRGTHGN